jgi:formate-dependent nitrite reductase membrane component NrfD
VLFGGRIAEHMVQVSYNAQHEAPWRWPVPAYLVTKAIASGLFLVLAAGWLLELFPFSGAVAVIAGFVSLLFIGLTVMLLVMDLERPERFLSILRRPQWRSWLARGAYVLVVFSVVCALWWLFEIGAYLYDYTHPIRTVFLWLGALLAVGAAIYTAFLFAQAEGRDLWQSPLLPAHLLLQALIAGCAILLLLAPILSLLGSEASQFSVGLAMPKEGELGAAQMLIWALAIALALDLFVTLVGEFGIRHASETATLAARVMTRGRYRLHFWGGGIILGHLLPLALLLSAAILAGPMQGVAVPSLLAAAAGLATIAGLYLYEYAFVMAPQEVPNS